MNGEYVQNLRYKMQKRVRRLNSTRSGAFHISLLHLWSFLHESEVLRGILDDLALRCPKMDSDAERVCNQKETLLGDTELEHAALCYFILKRCVDSKEEMHEVQIGYAFHIASDWDGHLEVFRDHYLEPLYEYLDEQLDDQRAVLALLRRYKHKCEWFCRDQLYGLWESNTQSGERNLAKHLYEYLHDQGIDFHIEPESASGKVDLIAMQRTDDPLVADAKIFDPGRSKGKSYIASGFAQVYRYTVDYNEPFGYLVIYLTGERDLRFALKQSAISTPFVVHNNKTIFLLTVDIYPHAESASKRGALAPVEITEDDLIAIAEEGTVAASAHPAASAPATA